MLYVRIELWPHGDKDNAKLLGEARIANTGKGTLDKGEYMYKVTGVNGAKLRDGMGHLTGFPRKKLLAWDLLYRILGKVRKAKN